MPGIEQQLQRERQAGVARQDRADGRQRAAGAVAADGQRRAVPGRAAARARARATAARPRRRRRRSGSGARARAGSRARPRRSRCSRPARGTGCRACAMLPMVKPPPWKYSSTRQRARATARTAAPAAARRRAPAMLKSSTRASGALRHFQHVGAAPRRRRAPLRRQQVHAAGGRARAMRSSTERIWRVSSGYSAGRSRRGRRHRGNALPARAPLRLELLRHRTSEHPPWPSSTTSPRSSSTSAPSSLLQAGMRARRHHPAADRHRPRRARRPACCRRRSTRCGGLPRRGVRPDAVQPDRSGRARGGRRSTRPAAATA